MTSKDYVLLADVLREHREDHGGDNFARFQNSIIARRIADALASDNPRFDRDRFLIAAGVPRAR